MSGEHTPTPWIQSGDVIYSEVGDANICVAGSPRSRRIIGYFKLEFSDPDFQEAMANLRFIVTACDSHAALQSQRDALLAACDLGLGELGRLLEITDVSDYVIDQLRAAIAAAKETP